MAKRRGLTLVQTSSVLSTHAGTIVLGHLLLGALFMSILESWSPSDALYFCVTTLTTVGYGDLAPKSASGRLFTSIFILIGSSLVASCLGTLVGRMQARLMEEAKAPAAVAGGVSREVNEMAKAVSFAGAIIAAGVLYASIVEGWSWVDAFYWASVSCSSVGLGDLVPSPVMRPVAGIYLLLAVGGFGASVARVARYTAAVELARRRDSFLERGVTAELLDELGEKGGGQVDRYAFMRYMLVASGQVDEAEVTKLDSLFDALDVDGSGSLDAGDIRAHTASRSHSDGSIDLESPRASASDGYELPRLHGGQKLHGGLHGGDSEDSELAVDDSAALLRSSRGKSAR